jgi:GT2 family glycosyltransferase
MKIDIVSVLIPEYKPDKKILMHLKSYLKSKKNIKIIELEGIGGLAKTYNKGIRMAKTDIIITIHQDCLPLEKDAIEKLIEPFNDKNIVMTYSWIKDMETGKKYYPCPPDGKFVAYRKSALEKVGFFDEKTFFTGGEDVDLYLKMKKIGKIVEVDTGIIHQHIGYLGNKTVEKRRQNGSINGCLNRVWGIKNPFWWKAIIMSIRYPATYGINFVRAFINKKQDYRRND